MTIALNDIPLTTITGEATTFGAQAGKATLVVNVASKCGLTPQYEGLEALYTRYKDKGLTVLGLPANDFGGQEPGSEDEIATFCTTNFAVDFPMFSKVVATGPDKHPLYVALTIAAPKAIGNGDAFREKLRDYGMTPTEEPELLWNFEKFLVGADGDVVARFAPDTAPNDPALISAIETELAR